MKNAMYVSYCEVSKKKFLSHKMCSSPCLYNKTHVVSSKPARLQHHENKMKEKMALPGRVIFTHFPYLQLISGLTPVIDKQVFFFNFTLII